MKTVIQFTKLRWFMIILSIIVIVGLNMYTLFFHKKQNLGIDFAGGLTTQVQIAPVAFTIGYTGEGSANLLIDSAVLTLRIAKGDKEEELAFRFNTYETVSALVSDLGKVDLITASVVNYGNARPERILPLDKMESLVKGYMFAANIGLASQSEVTVVKDDISRILDPMDKPSIQSIGESQNQEFFIKIQQSYLSKLSIEAGKKAEPNEGQAGAEDKAAEDEEETSDVQKDTVRAAEKTMLELLSAKYDPRTIRIKATEFVGPSFSQELLQGAIFAVLIGILLVLMYVTFRFKFDFGIGGIAAMIHDVLVMIGIIGFLQLEWNSTMIAAMLTIVGYSINDTIVVYDRIRENMKLLHDQNMEAVINTSVTQTLSRTIMTSLTVFISVIPIAVYTGGSIKEFAIAMIAGLISGTYSTIFIAAPIVLSYRNLIAMSKKRKLESAFGKSTPDKIEQQEKPVTPVTTGGQDESGDASVTENAENQQAGEAGSPVFARLRRHKKKKKKKRR